MKQDPNFVPEPLKERITDEEHMGDLAAGMKARFQRTPAGLPRVAPCLPPLQVGDRCEVNPGGKRGSVQFVGKLPAIAPGFWVGVQYDEPVRRARRRTLASRPAASRLHRAIPRRWARTTDR